MTTPTTEAGRRLLGDLAGDTEGTVVLDAYRSGLCHDVLAIEAEARADLAARIEALLPGTIREYTGHPSTPDAEWGWAKFRDAVLAIIREEAERE